jgi:hypothetical protein
MQCVADFEIKTDVSVLHDDLRLRLKHPTGQFQARLKNIPRKDFTTPFLLSLQIIFEVPAIQEAPEVAQERLAECLNMLVLATGARFERHRTKQIVDCAQGGGMKDCLIWAAGTVNDDPQPFLSERLMTSIERLLQYDQPPAIRRALRWYRRGVNAPIPDDQFQYFWFALEILAEFQKGAEKVPDRCPDCRSPLYCETCKTHPTHKQYVKQAIRDLILTVDKDCNEKDLTSLEKTRNALMHGAVLDDIEDKIHRPGLEMVDVLGKIVFRALVNLFPKDIFKEKVNLGSPSTYVHRTLTAYVHAQTIVPLDRDGEVELDRFSGVQVTREFGRPPQSGLSVVVEINDDQIARLAPLARNKSDHRELCERIQQNVRRSADGRKAVTLVYATDMAQIKKAIERGETGVWQDLFREIMAANAVPNYWIPR